MYRLLRVLVLRNECGVCGLSHSTRIDCMHTRGNRSKRTHMVLRDVERSETEVCEVSGSKSFFYGMKLQVHHEANPLVLVVLAVVTIYAFGAVFVSAQLAQWIIDSFTDITDELDQFCWYKFPIEVQRYYPMIVHCTQQEVVIECFGSLTCNREAFKKVKYTRTLLVRDPP